MCVICLWKELLMFASRLPLGPHWRAVCFGEWCQPVHVTLGWLHELGSAQVRLTMRLPLDGYLANCPRNVLGFKLENKQLGEHELLSSLAQEAAGTEYVGICISREFFDCKTRFRLIPTD